jgi:hypothetical protein
LIGNVASTGGAAIDSYESITFVYYSQFIDNTVLGLHTGGVFHDQSSEGFLVVGSKFFNNYASKGGVLSGNSDYTFIDCYFFNNTASYTGGVAVVSGVLTLSMSNCTISQSSGSLLCFFLFFFQIGNNFLPCFFSFVLAYNGGVFSLEAGAVLQYNFGVISHSYASFAAGIASLDSTSSFVFRNSLLSNNRAVSGGCFLLHAFATGFLYNTEVAFSYSQTQGSVFTIIDNSVLTIQDSNIHDGYSIDRVCFRFRSVRSVRSVCCLFVVCLLSDTRFPISTRLYRAPLVFCSSSQRHSLARLKL